VIPAPRLSGKGALDDVIRKQLADQSIARRTAVTRREAARHGDAAREKGEVSTACSAGLPASSVCFQQSEKT